MGCAAVAAAALDRTGEVRPMRAPVVPPGDCTTRAEIRTAIDALDREIVALLAARMRYIEAAARVKQHRGAVRDEWRKADVIAKARAAAAANEPSDRKSVVEGKSVSVRVDLGGRRSIKKKKTKKAYKKLIMQDKHMYTTN